ncbi:DUF3293 domain-containing protein [Rhizobium sp. CRIBSB]|nr:DUF3293 domain-containing protein [Rhizobium sp. CRIBSB]
MELLIPADLLRAYEAAHYWVDFPAGRIVLKIGQTFLGVGGFTGLSRVAVITACNPFSEVLGDAENAARQAVLIEAVEAAGLEWFHAAGFDPQENWVPEPSLAILDPSDQQLDAWMEAFGQNAVVVADVGGLVALRLHPRSRVDRL